LDQASDVRSWNILGGRAISGIGQERMKTNNRSLYPTQTKILEGGTKDDMQISKEAIFKGVSTQFGPCSIEKCVLRNPHFIFCSSLQNRRLGSINYKSKYLRFPFDRGLKARLSLFLANSLALLTGRVHDFHAPIIAQVLPEMFHHVR
jgi:hypothetical protein